MHIYVILTAAALIAAMTSAIIGMGGGILLLATVFCFMPHADAIPLHAAVQLVSNSTRVLAFLRSVDWRVFRRFVAGAIPGSVVAVFLLRAIGRIEDSEPYLKILIGAYILVATNLPKPQKTHASGAWWDWPLMGLAAGSAALLVGAAGPLIAPLFARRNFAKERLIATKATCQMFLHLGKLPAFVYLRYAANDAGTAASSFAFTHLGLLALLMAIAVVPGTLLGKHLLTHVSERTFLVLFKVAMIAAGLKTLLYDGLAPLLL